MSSLVVHYWVVGCDIKSLFHDLSMLPVFLILIKCMLSNITLIMLFPTALL